jgi:hypothetical protein
MENSSGSGSGSGSGSNEKRGRKGKDYSPWGSDERNMRSSDSETVVQPQMSEKREGSESPVDPVMFYRNSKSSRKDNERDPSPGTTLASSHNNESRRSVRNTLTRSQSSEHRLSQRHSHVSALHALHNDPEPITPSALDPVLFPEPLRVSRPPSEEYRPYSSDSNTHRAFHHPNIERPRTSERPRTTESEALSFSYPGRLKADGLRRTESGRDTYWPDGVEVENSRRGVSRRTSGGSGVSGRSGMAARDAGRAY